MFGASHRSSGRAHHEGAVKAAKRVMPLLLNTGECHARAGGSRRRRFPPMPVCSLSARLHSDRMLPRSSHDVGASASSWALMTQAYPLPGADALALRRPSPPDALTWTSPNSRTAPPRHATLRLSGAKAAAPAPAGTRSYQAWLAADCLIELVPVTLREYSAASRLPRPLAGGPAEFCCTSLPHLPCHPTQGGAARRRTRLQRTKV